ncbi:hypothetical protein Pryu01_01222 [Paraliobacillus ryukyuensis]|uniref:Uncharacterized protein DUF1617 n=1 Tax=Paraliobacillus ryukyuensis TaxID=200904 RepID=A0A366DM36_9BACI|nr:DUF1617 family protein [Paraliobacillus ryukyuensis]RBO91121.1 uncharacterized protein DUF1617 [Paraliobacillus ryukyuensis]
MQVTIKNAHLGQATSLLFDLALKGKQSRHRTKFIKLLAERSKEVEEQRKQLAEEHANKDGGDKPIIKDEKYDIADQEAFQKDIQELYEEEIVIEGGDHQDMLKTVKWALDECDKAYSGKEAVIYDYLCDQFEEGDDK